MRQDVLSGPRLWRGPATQGHPWLPVAVVGALVLAGMAASLFVLQAGWLDRLRSAPWTFSDVDDVAVQHAELVAYLADTGRPMRLVVVDLAAHRKVSQFTDIDASRLGYGRNACGLVAAAAALGGAEWTTLVDRIADAAEVSYRPSAGIQPTPYVAALQAVFGAERVAALDRGSLGALHQQLEAGRVVIADVKVNRRTGRPAGHGPTYAHFARVLGIDAEAGEVYLENTLYGDAYWTVPFETFMSAWQYPETTATMIPDPLAAEPVTRWAVAIVPKPRDP